MIPHLDRISTEENVTARVYPHCDHVRLTLTPQFEAFICHSIGARGGAVG